MRGQKVSKRKWNKLLKELEKNIGLVGISCHKAGIGRSTYYNYRIENKEFAKEADSIIENFGIAVVQDELMKAIFEGKGWAIIFYLMCKDERWRPYSK